MTLTGAPLLILLACLTVAAFAAVIRYWPRFAGKGIRPLSGRLAVLAAAQILPMCTVAAVTNSYFGFYTSWSALFSVASGNYAASTPSAFGVGPSGTGSPAPQGSTVVVHGHSGLTMPGGGNPQQAGQIEDTTIQGQISGLSARALIYLPPQYFQAAYRNTLFPAVIVSSGYPGDVTKLATLLRYPERLATGIAAGQDKPMVLIMMSPMIVTGRDTECTDVPGGGPHAETFSAQDVPSAVERSYRVAASASAWGLVGDSTGGYCALKLAMMNSDVFSAAASLSGYFDALQDSTTGDLYGGDQAFRQQNDLMWRITHLPSPPIAALLTTSKTGESNYGPTLRFSAAAKAPMRVSTLIRAQGGHNFNTWNAEVPAALQWLSSLLVSTQSN